MIETKAVDGTMLEKMKPIQHLNEDSSKDFRQNSLVINKSLEEIKNLQTAEAAVRKEQELLKSMAVSRAPMNKFVHQSSYRGWNDEPRLEKAR